MIVSRAQNVDAYFTDVTIDDLVIGRTIKTTNIKSITSDTTIDLSDIYIKFDSTTPVTIISPAMTKLPQSYPSYYYILNSR